jgi:hypothetical protein
MCLSLPDLWQVCGFLWALSLKGLMLLNIFIIPDVVMVSFEISGSGLDTLSDI